MLIVMYTWEKLYIILDYLTLMLYYFRFFNCYKKTMNDNEMKKKKINKNKYI